MKDKYQELKKWFESYVSNFKLSEKEDQKNINLKIDHSYRVCKEMDRIVESFSLNKKEKYTANIIALFHDVGRFMQYKKYKTFSDYESEDHAILGNNIMKENNLLDNINPHRRNLIYKAIFYHNKPKLPEDNDNLFYAKLIRDADKLDIWNIFIQKYEKEDENNHIIKLQHTPEINEKIYRKVLNNELIKYNTLKSVNDLKMMQISWIYDINFKKTLELIKERNYLEIIYNSMDKNSKTDFLYEKINKYLNKKLKTKQP